MAGGAGTYAPSLRHYGKTLKAEAGLGIALLLMVSIMANGALPSGQFPVYERDQQGGQSVFAEEPRTDFVRTLYTGEGRVQLVVSPFAVGQNRFVLSFYNQDGSNATGIESATIKLTQLERGIGPIEIETVKQSDNVFSANAAFSLPGIWHVEIEGVNTQGSNMLATLDANVKPQVSNLEFSIANYTTPSNSVPLYPVFDAQRQSIWAGDTRLASGRIWQLDIETGNYTAHRLDGIDIVTQMLLAPNGSLWFIDPLAFRSGNGTLGVYDPESNATRQFKLTEPGIMSGLAMDGNGSLWMPLIGTGANRVDKMIKFDPANEQFSSFEIPTPLSRPAGIAADREGNIWFTEAATGIIGKVDPATGNITEYKPRESQALEEPASIFPDPMGSNIYIGEHSGHTVTAFNPLLGTFREYPSVNEAGLPFGMAMDGYGNLWFAEHEIDRIGVIDPRTGEGTEAKIPITGSLIQWITADDSGRIWFAAQRGNALGSITITAKPATAPQPGNGTDGGQAGGIPQLPFSFVDFVGPAIAIGIVGTALAYSKSVVDLKRNVHAVGRLDRR
jgi:copper transport protein